MYPGSSQSESDLVSQDDGFTKPKTKKRGRKPNSTPSSSNPTTPTQDLKRPALEKPATRATTNREKTSTQTSPPPSSIVMTNNLFRNPTFKLAFYVTSPPTLTRVQLAVKWEEINKSNKDIIIKQESNFLIKTNDEETTTKSLELLKQRGIITSFKVQKSNNTSSPTTTTNRNITPSYSAVATGVDLDITDEMFSDHLKSIYPQIRFCKRIISRQRGAPTLMIRLITGDHSTYERLMANRFVHFLGRIFRIIESKPPPPIPAPCSKCNAYDHRSEDCRKPLKCNRCQGTHPTSACTSPLPVRCATCNSDDHAAWSMKCPKRPTAPIEGIPNVKVKCLNKRTAEVSNSVTAHSRVHTPITTHDHIINKYKHQLNKTENNNREELIKKLRKRFIEDFNVDTSVVFFGNHMYILMIDMLSPDRTSPTEPLDQLRQTITNIEHSI